MYVFIKIELPVVDEKFLYELTVDDDLIEIERWDGYVVYAYTHENMKMLNLEDITDPLFIHMRMRNISNADYDRLDDINIRITRDALGIALENTLPIEAWNTCKSMID